LSKKVILFTTVDADGWPRHGMLSRFEIVAKSRENLLMLLYESSHSTENLKREGKVSLTVIDADMSYYVCCQGRPVSGIPEAPSEVLFELSVEKVVEDSLPTATIASGITFEGYDPGMSRENREEVFQKLLSM
jgi:hypothetical protein